MSKQEIVYENGQFFAVAISGSLSCEIYKNVGNENKHIGNCWTKKHAQLFIDRACLNPEHFS